MVSPLRLRESGPARRLLRLRIDGFGRAGQAAPLRKGTPVSAAVRAWTILFEFWCAESVMQSRGNSEVLFYFAESEGTAPICDKNPKVSADCHVSMHLPARKRFTTIPGDTTNLFVGAKPAYSPRCVP